jgi:hypothetical protein
MSNNPICAGDATVCAMPRLQPSAATCVQLVESLERLRQKNGIDKQEIGQWIKSMPRLFIAQSPERVIPKAPRRQSGWWRYPDGYHRSQIYLNHVMLDAICSICHYKQECFPS